MRHAKMKAANLLLALLLSIFATTSRASSPCPWSTQASPELESACTCDYNLAHELSVQCNVVDFGQLISGLRRFASNQASRIDLLFVNNSTIGLLRNGSFAGFRIVNLQLSGCKLKGLEPEALAGQESSLRSLNLRDNELTDIPRQTLSGLKNLTVLDLSRNKIARVPDNAFKGHRLVTLKLAGNSELALESTSFKGLEATLKNLNLMGTRQRRLPDALRGLRTLAFLDMSQNSIRELGGSAGFQGLTSLTGLNLERNLIQAIASDAFTGVASTLSSLSLLNNLIPEFPLGAIAKLRELKVLDIGFNLMTELPERAFEGNPSLTLLAIDGNPLSTVPEEAFAGLRGTLRGLSLGGRFLVCDCKLRWIAEWINSTDLQVTSRESKPQFCGSPARLQDRKFNHILPEEMTCERQTEIVGIGTVESVEPTGALLDAIQQQQQPTPSPGTVGPSTLPSRPSSSSNFETSTSLSTTVATHTPTTLAQPSSNVVATRRPSNVFVTRTSLAPRPPLVLGSPLYKSRSQEREIIIKEALRQDNSVIIKWDSESITLGFKVIYRLFGDSTFKAGPPLENSEREFRIKNVPTQECLVVCVVSAEDSSHTPATVPPAQCREVRTDVTTTSNLEKITIAVSVVLCLGIFAALIGVIVMARCRRSSSRKLHTLQEPGKLPIAGLPVNCCSSLVGPTPSPGGGMGAPLPGTQASLSAYSVQKEWDQLSAYSTRSIPRPRIFPVDRQGSVTRASCLDDGGPHGHGSMNGPGRGHYFTGTTSLASASIVGLASRADLRHSRQSLAAASERMARSNGFPSGVQLAPQAQSNTRRQRPRSRNRGMDPGLPRPGSRYSLAESTHTLNNYEESNWTDHDMDIYMARNPTTRGGLVPL